MATRAADIPLVKPSEKKGYAKRQEAVAGYGFAFPAFAILFVFMIIPLFVAAFFSLTNWNGVRPLTGPAPFEYIGMENYQRLLVDGRRVQDFYNALKNTLYYVFGVVPTQTIIALVLATIVNQKWLRGRSFFRTAFYFPSITSSIVVSMIFLFLFSNTGPVNGALNALFSNYENVSWLSDNNGLIHNFLEIFGITRETATGLTGTEVFNISLWDWISGPSVALFTIMLLAIWTTIGTMMVVYLAALQGIPSHVYEAAAVDGATPWQIFRLITLPLLRPTTFFVVTLGLIGTFQVFDQIYVLNSDQTARTTTSVAYLVYDLAFGQLNDPQMGRATATAITLFVIIFIATILQRRFVGGDRQED